jgi:hypothetical protein
MKIIVVVTLMAIALTSCGMFSTYGVSGAPEGDDEYDFSVFFGHSEDPITVGRIVLRYKVKTGISIQPIMTEAGTADERALRRYLGASNPPAAFALPADAEDYISASGIDWKFHGRGLAADRRVLADLIGEPDAAAPSVDAFAEDIRCADYREWSIFLDGLGSYINGATYAAITLNGKPYSFAESKGRYSSLLNGVFAVSGADSSFVGTMLMDLAAMTSDHDLLSRSRLIPTPQAFDIASPVFDVYIEALSDYTSNIGGLYAPGVRGNDFIDDDIYSPEYTGAVFAGCKAVFTPFDSEDYTENDDADVTQAEQIVILPVKMPYAEHWLSGYLAATDVNKSLRMDTKYSLCVNEEAPPSDKSEAQAFIEWLAADSESSNAIQLCLAGYDAKGAGLPLLSDEDRGDMEGVEVFGEVVYESVLKPMLSDPDWQAEEIQALKDSVESAWYASD